MLLKNILAFIFSALLISGCAAFPAAFTIGMLAGSTAAYLGTQNPADAYLYINSSPPEEPMTCFNYLAEPDDVFYYTAISGQIWIGEKGTKNWLKKEDWEGKYGKIKKGEINEKTFS